ncbi:TIGR00730 family Rossman fold protein [Latilactobacillus fuchuensis]|uniref:LOG family protein n=1 Tax=Latilactobacillus fuchuensis TaxID=164393 RepID=UPI0039AF672A
MVNVAVYCGASMGNKPIYAEAAKTLGTWLVQRGDRLIYGGGQVGLMGTIADAVLQQGGQVTGIMPAFLNQRELMHTGLTETLIVDDMATRKHRMIELAEVFIALPGGPGTLEEMSEVISWARIGQQDGPCIFYNVAGYYDLLQQFLAKMVSEGFLTQVDFDKYLFTTDLTEMATFITGYQPPKVRQY